MTYVIKFSILFVVQKISNINANLAFKVELKKTFCSGNCFGFKGGNIHCNNFTLLHCYKCKAFFFFFHKRLFVIGIGFVVYVNNFNAITTVSIFGSLYNKTFIHFCLNYVIDIYTMYFLFLLRLKEQIIHNQILFYFRIRCLKLYESV